MSDQQEVGAEVALTTREVFMRELEAAMGQTPVSVIIIDLDHAKQINETHGHAAGDAVLSEVSRILFETLTPSDVVTPGRIKDEASEEVTYGEEEMLVLLREASAEVATHKAEEILEKIEAIALSEYPDLRVTASLGVASSAEASDAKGLLRNADYVLYQAKGNGRNRVETYNLV